MKRYLTLAVMASAAVLTCSASLSRREIPSRMAASEVPKGQVVNYDKFSVGTWKMGNSISMYQDIFPASIIYGDDNKVYFKNLVSVFPDEYYIEGTLEGNTITVETGQLVFDVPEDGYGINFGVFSTYYHTVNGNEVVDFEFAHDIKSISFDISDDGSILMVLPGEPFDGKNPPEYVAGFYFNDDYSFTGYCDFYQEYTKLDIVEITIPEEAEIKTYSYVDSFSYASLVDVAEYDGYLYIRGLTDMLPEGTIKAKIDGDKAYVEQDEYLGVYFDLYYIFTKVLYTNPDYDPEDPESEELIFAPADATFQLNIDRENNKIYADKEDVYLSFHCDFDDFLNSLGLFGVFELKLQETMAGTPADPVDLEYTTEWADQQGFNDFFFTLSNFSTEGNVLDVDCLYYKVFVNGTPVVFVEHEQTDLLGRSVVAYSEVPIEVNLLPYEFNNNEDIFKMGINAFDIGIYTNDVRTIGVQSVYHYDNEFTYSNIVTIETAGAGKTAEDVMVEATEYFTLDGRRVNNPANGIYIQRQRLSDGTSRTVKTVL